MNFTVVSGNKEKASALFDIAYVFAKGQKVSAADLLLAINKDLSSGTPLSKVLFAKYVAFESILNQEELRGLLEMLKLAIIAKLEESPEAVKSYTDAALICVEQINKTKNHYQLAQVA